MEYVVWVVSFLLFTFLAWLLFHDLFRFGSLSGLFFSARHQFVFVQAGFTSSVSQRLDPAMIKIAAAVKDYALDSLLQGPLGNGLADSSRGLDVAAARATQIFLNRGSRNNSLAFLIVNYLRIDMVDAAVYRQTRPLAAASHLAANTPVNRLSN